MTVEQNLAAVEQLVKELNLQNCNLRTPDVLARLYNLSSSTPPKGASLDSSPTLSDYGRLRTKRDESGGDEQVNPTLLAKAKYIYDLYTHNGASRDDSSDGKVRSTGYPWKTSSENDGIVGKPFPKMKFSQLNENFHRPSARGAFGVPKTRRF